MLGPATLEPLAYTVPQLTLVAGIGRAKLYELIATGELRSVRRGGRRLVLKQDLESFLRGEAA
jgi:excisionase family DNA binding protein